MNNIKIAIRKVRINITDEITTYGYTLSMIYMKIGSITCLLIFSLFSSLLISPMKNSMADFENFSIIYFCKFFLQK